MSILFSVRTYVVSKSQLASVRMQISLPIHTHVIYFF